MEQYTVTKKEKKRNKDVFKCDNCPDEFEHMNTLGETKS